jgi:hypothetical protein
VASRDEYTDSSRTGPPRVRTSCMSDCDYTVGTLAEEKLRDPNSVGTASDYAGVTSEANRNSVRR